MATSAAWLVRLEARTASRMRLFCFPCAGGGTTPYRSWRKHLPPEVGLFVVRLPGRESRLSEPAYTDLALLTEELCRVLAQESSDVPCAFFGHSMGARIAFETARTLRRHRLPLPNRLFVAGCNAPHLPNRNPPLHHLPDPELKQQLARLGGTPRELLEHDELMALALPTIRADFKLWETYRYQPEPPLGCPISAYGGTSDPRVSRDEIAAWGEQTSATFDLQMMPGDHFFVQSAADDIVQDIASKSIGPRAAAAVSG